MSCLPKPVLRGHMKRKGLRALFGAITFGAINGSIFHFFYRVPKEKRYEEFYRTYDSAAHTRDMVNWGYFQTIRPEDLRKSDD